jgi:hypothetical protein
MTQQVNTRQVAAPEQRSVVIDSEDLTTGGRGGSDEPVARVFDQYQTVGVRFNGVAALDYSKGVLAIPGFAHSGTIAIEACYGQEFCAEPVEVRFLTAPQRRVKVWVGYSEPHREDLTVVLTGFDHDNNPVGRASGVLPASATPQPIRTPLEINADDTVIARATIGFDPPTSYTNNLAVDDIEFDLVGPPPPCPSSAPPVVVWTSPADGAVVQRNAFLLDGAVSTGARLESAVLKAVARSGGTRVADVWPGLDGGTLGPTEIDGLLFLGTNTLLLEATDCAGITRLSRVITHTPLPSDVQFVLLGMDVFQDGALIPNNGVLIAGRPTMVRVYLRVTGSVSAVTNVGGALAGYRAGVPPARLSELQGPLAPGRLLARNTITVDGSTDLEAKRHNPAAALVFNLPRDWVTPGLLHLSVGPLSIEGADTNVPCEGCDNTDAHGNPNFLWFREAWPILETTYLNPARATTSPTWNSDLVGGRTFRDDTVIADDIVSAIFESPEPTPHFEWIPVLDSGDGDSTVVGASGTAIRPILSGEDVPFTHPFGFDWEFFVAPDPPYWQLLAPSNTGPDQEYAAATQDAVGRGLLQPGVGVLGVEIDQDLIPMPFRLHDGDRVAVFGRWIVDAGHEDFHTEIHPPLLIANARVLVTPPESDGGVPYTASWLISRPFFVGQVFAEGGLFRHLMVELLRAAGWTCPWYWPPFLPCTTRFEAHPPVRRVPFLGRQEMSYLVRPPEPRPSASADLLVSGHFTVRPGVRVELSPAGSDAVLVTVVMEESAYQPPPLPRRSDLSVSEGDLPADVQAGFRALVAAILGLAGFAHAAWFSVVLGRGILTDRYAAPRAISAADTQNVLRDVPAGALAGRRATAIGTDQPFPVYGWLTLRWA